MSFQYSQPASLASPATHNQKHLTYDFTKRKRWADLLITDVSDAIILVLSTTAKVLYCGTAVNELLGWRDVDLVDNNLLDFINHNDHSQFRTHYDQSIHTGAELSIYIRFQCKNVFNEDGSRKDVLFEFQGYLHPVPDQEDVGTCFFAIAKPYLSRSTNSLNAFLELKMENERLQQRVAALRSQVNQLPATPPVAGDVLPTQAQASRIHEDPQTKVSRALYDAGAYANISLYTSTPSSLIDEETPEESSRRKKPKKLHTAEQHVCVTCGRTDSPEWRKGPLGPKTLCNACGLRWAKEMRRNAEPDGDRRNAPYNVT